MATGGKIRVVQSLEPQTMLEYKRRQTDPYLSQERLTMLFQAAGGEATLSTIGAWLRGEREPGAHQTYLLCQIINDYLPEDADLIPLVPFFLAPSGSGDGAKTSKSNKNVAKTKRASDHNRWNGPIPSEQELLSA